MKNQINIKLGDLTLKDLRHLVSFQCECYKGCVGCPLGNIKNCTTLAKGLDTISRHLNDNIQILLEVEDDEE